MTPPGAADARARPRLPDLPALLIAVATALLLAGGAAFGGPHGALGAAPWLLNLPGILFVVAVPSDAYIPLRITLAFGTQVALWYLVVARWRAARRTPPAGGTDGRR